jgi:glycosyltransferase involved in cell wall biosynthesis
MLAISVIIPAYNAAETLAATIDALLAQTYPHWEAIVIDDGSIDATAAIVTDFAAHDQRIRLIQQANAGVITARNVGIAAAQHDWLLFNDADDWIAPTHFAKMVAVLQRDSTLDAVHCGWSRVAADGTIVNAKFAPEKSDMFPDLACYCTFHVNTCIVRKILVESVGGFDPRIAYCEDWDLWQRIARQGARFAALPEVLAFYRMQPNSLSSHVQSFCRDGLQVLAYGHGSDSRVSQPQAEYVAGMPAGALPVRQLYFTSWCAGLLIGRGEDATTLLDLIHGGNVRRQIDPIFLEVKWIAENLFETIPIPNSVDFSQWHQLLPKYLPLVQSFLQALEAHTQIQGLQDLVRHQLVQKVLQYSATQLPLTIGDIHALTIDIVQPITPQTIPAPARQLYAQITHQGAVMGWLHLPVINRQVATSVILDSIANQLTQPLLAQLLNHSEIYNSAAFLQTLWQRPNWTLNQFYDPNVAELNSPMITVTDDWLQLDAAQPLPTLKILGAALRVGLWLGDQRIGTISFAGNGMIVSSQQLRATFTESFEPALRRAYVRSWLQRSHQPHSTHYLGVSIIIPAYNAARHLRQTLTSLQSQTSADWEAIVVDDGSTDRTLAIVMEFAQTDSRIRVIQQFNQGGCAARNHGLSQAYFDWVVFLDADDWWAPTYLAKMTAELSAQPRLDAVRCAWDRMTADGSIQLERFTATADTDTFELCTLACGFQMETCIVQRALVEAVGGFDPRQKAAQDWDLWQRIARTGARFGIIPEVLSYYRTMTSSVSSGGLRLFEHGLQVIARGHGPDSRVLAPDPRYAAGRAPQSQPIVEYYFMLWCAGLEIAQGRDARSLLSRVQTVDPASTPTVLAHSLRSLYFSSGLAPDRWYILWFTVETDLTQFLNALELRLNQPGFAASTLGIMQRDLLKHALLPQTIGLIQGIHIDISQPIPDILSQGDRLFCSVYIAGRTLGEMSLPLPQGYMRATVLADAIAGEYFWWILGEFFRQTRYTAAQSDHHDTIGWTHFLQALFDQPDWETAQFYQTTDQPDRHHIEQLLDQPQAQIEISEPLPTLQLSFPLSVKAISVLFTVGGAPFGVIPVPVSDDRITAATLRTTLLNTNSLELCRLCVRVGILGQPINSKRGLRSRLQAAAKQLHPPIDRTQLPPIASCWIRANDAADA